MEAASPKDPLRPMPWWSSPVGINLGFLLPILLLIAYVGDSAYSGLTIRGIRFLTVGYIGLACGALLIASLGGWIGSHITADAGQERLDSSVNWDCAALTVGGIALCAYLFWFRDFLFNPLLLLDTLLGRYRPDRTTIPLTTGITSLTNAAPVFFSIYAYKSVVLGQKLTRSMRVMCGALLAFTLFRVYAWSERLAMIEAMVPFGISFAALLGRSPGRVTRLVSGVGPFAALPLLILYFAVFEYVRSWQSPTYNQHLGFWEFAIGRLASYYYTSLNNGAGLLVTGNWPSFQFENTLNWLHRAPVIGPMFSSLVDLQFLRLDGFLHKFGDVEFNNPSGIYAVFYDLGLPCGVACFCVTGFLGGMAFRAFRAGALGGVLFYPLFFIAFLEIFREPYLGASRAFTWTLGIAAALLIIRLRSAASPLPEEHGLQSQGMQLT